MPRPPKTGRRASQSERDRARQLVDLYRQAQAAGGTLVFNPEDPPEKQQTYRASPENLLRALERFANTGTFANRVDTSRMIANLIAQTAGPKKEDRVHLVSEEMNVSERTAERLLSRKK